MATVGGDLPHLGAAGLVVEGFILAWHKIRRRSPPRKKLTGNKANVERVKLSTIPEAC